MATCKISQYTVSPTEEFFFDTNIWMFIFAPIAGSQQKKQKVYSAFFSEILSRSATIWINSQVVAEYINRCLHIEFDQWKDRTKDYGADFKRDFRSTPEYLSALNDAKSNISAILQKCERHPDDFNSIKIDSIIASMGSSRDYGDAIIVDLCKRKKFKLVTDDGDMTKNEFSFDVITA
jgi:predicted nucleic acid-binding protein